MNNVTIPSTIFLETTIQIERVLGSRERQANLRAELGNYCLITSHYVLGEYLRTIVKDAIQLYQLLLKHAHLDDVMTAIGQHINKREASRMMLVLGAALRNGYVLEPTTQAQSELIDRLLLMINVLFLRRFHADIDEMIDDVQCGLARERPVALPSTMNPTYQLRSQCVRTVRECSLAERMQTWQPQLEALADGLRDATDPALSRMGKLASRIIEEPILARGRNCTWHLGDMVIALELPTDVPLYTTNRRHFEPILEILGKQLHEPSI